MDGHATFVLRWNFFVSITFPDMMEISLLFSIANNYRYVAMHAMQEDSSADHSHSSMNGSNGYSDSGIQRKAPKPQMRDTLAAVGGMLLPLLTQLGHHH